MSVHVAVGVYVDADVAVSVDAHVGVQALFKGADTCMANLLVHVCVPVLLDSSKALTCAQALCMKSAQEHAAGTFNRLRPNVSQQ